MNILPYCGLIHNMLIQQQTNEQKIGLFIEWVTTGVFNEMILFGIFINEFTFCFRLVNSMIIN